MRRFFRDLFTNVSNQHFELARVLTAVGTVSVIGAQVFALIKGLPFDAASLGIGLATVIGGGAAGIAMKDRARTNDISVNIGTE